MSRTPLFTTAALAVLLAGCAVGPSFVTPAAPNASTYSPDGLPNQTAAAETTGGASQKFVPGGPIPSQWWELFRSDALSRLVIQALNNNPTLQAAQASLRVAQENLSAANSGFFPSIDGQAGVSRNKSDAGGVPRPAYSLYNASVNVGYTLDIFGGVRRGVEAAEARTDFQRYELEAAHLALTANVVTTAIQEAALRAQIAATQDIIDVNKKSLELLQTQFSLGGVAKAAVLAQAATLAQTQATMPPLEKQLAQTRHLLAALLGQFPNERIEATFDLAGFTLPQELPLTLPSQLVAQRPDIKAAAAQLREASANVGVATAAMLPQITLSGSYGANNGQLADLLSPQSAMWNLGAGLLQPLFRGGELLHQRRAAEAAYDAAAAQYRATVLTAFQSVADSLQALQSDADALKAQLAAERAAADSLQLSQEQFKVGAISYLSLLDAEQTYEQTKIALVQAQARRYADTAALFQALGGGWQAGAKDANGVSQ